VTTAGPLEDGEMEHATAWAKAVAGRVAARSTRS